MEKPHYPIVYVRGYAGSQSEVEETVATPYMGFNLGSTKIRQRWNKDVVVHFFESPLVRLMKDHGYRDVYSAGAEPAAPASVSPKSVFIYRYYDEVSEDVGTGDRPEIQAYAEGLGKRILAVRRLVCGDDEATWGGFRVYLVAHSMGGLICRCFLQNLKLNQECAIARKYVDKVFTYATPHRGIDMKVIGNVPGFFSRNNSENFNREQMRRYLDLPAAAGYGVDSLAERFDADRFFCLVGTNARDYAVASGWSTRMVGELSDGLVRIENATVNGAPRAFVHRSHSGHYGIVNSEDGYQNLVRFLFGDVRVDGKLVVDEITLPPKVERQKAAGRKIRASYNFEAVVRTRGATWDLHRRTVATNSAILRTYDELFPADGTKPRSPYLFSTYLSAGKRVNSRRRSLGFSIELGVLVPSYEIDGALWFDDHYDGGYLYRDKINFEVVPPVADDGEWTVRYGFDSRSPNRTTRTVVPERVDGALLFTVPIQQNSKPGIRARLQLSAKAWNS